MDYLANAHEVFKIEVDAIYHVEQKLNQNFTNACNLIYNAKGRVIVIGMGKSGHIGNKIAATLASTGTPAFFIHPAEAAHGDFGMITKDDVIIAISNSGNTEEIIKLLPLINRINIPLIAMTGNANSILAKAATVMLDIQVNQEACPHNLAPTASTTVTLVLGDALAIALLKARGFTEEDFAFSHPAGVLGKRLILRVCDLMKSDDHIPKVTADTLLKDAIIVMTEKGLGMTTVINEDNKLLGIFTDGDLRRIFTDSYDIKTTPISQVMTTTPKTILANEMATKALNLMESYKITAVVVTDENQKLQGIIHMHDLLQAGIV